MTEVTMNESAGPEAPGGAAVRYGVRGVAGMPSHAAGVGDPFQPEARPAPVAGERMPQCPGVHRHVRRFSPDRRLPGAVGAAGSGVPPVSTSRAKAQRSLLTPMVPQLVVAAR
jgi:hypothetical protein